MKPVIEIKQLGKKYYIRKAEPYLALRDTITNSVRNVFRSRTENKKDFWALRDINLEIAAGERIGIIGRNGAGKSTLLKILSRITKPTTGEAIIRGRVASLLEVGTGFHPELTGRENVYLNGSILGLKKSEIDRQFEAIVDFSGVEEFLDTPLKNYSSGMQLRLAFAVAAHLEPEILLIDEVLAVGDMEFQKKCLGKMEEVSKQHGRTILFVSHNLGFIQSFCPKSILLDSGKLLKFANTHIVIDTYLEYTKTKKINLNYFGNGDVRIEELDIKNKFTSADQLFLGYPAGFKIKLKAFKKLGNIEIAFNIKDAKQDLISHVTSLDKQLQIKAEANDTIVAEIILSQINVTPGNYSIDLFILNNNEMCWGCESYTEFSVVNSDKALRPNGFPPHVKTFTDSTWKVEKI